MGFIKNYFIFAFDFVGVVGRSEFWKTMGFIVFVHLLFAGLSLLGVVFQLLLLIVNIILLIPTLSLMARRMHDTDRTALNLFWLLLPLIGWAIVIIYLIEKTKYFVN